MDRSESVFMLSWSATMYYPFAACDLDLSSNLHHSDTCRSGSLGRIISVFYPDRSLISLPCGFDHRQKPHLHCGSCDIAWKHSTKHNVIRYIINWFICDFNLRRVKLQETGPESEQMD